MDSIQNFLPILRRWARSGKIKVPASNLARKEATMPYGVPKKHGKVTQIDA